MTAESEAAPKAPAKGDLVSHEGQFFTIDEITKSLDGAHVSASASSESAFKKSGISHFSCKVSDLKSAGEVAGTAIWGR